MIDFTGGFAPLILLSPLLVALAAAFVFTNRLSARIAKRNAKEEEAAARQAEERKSETEGSVWPSSPMFFGDKGVPYSFVADPSATNPRGRCRGKGKSRGKTFKRKPRHKTA